MDGQKKDRSDFEYAARMLQGDLALAGKTGVQEGWVRARYQRDIGRLISELRAEAENSRISWKQAAEEAHLVRNETMDLMRARSSSIGLAYAQSLKREGRTLNELIAKYTIRRFGGAAQYGALDEAGKDLVFADIVAAAGRADPAVSALVVRLSRAGRGLLFLSLAISVYDVWSSDDHIGAAEKEAAVTGGGVLGGMAGGALAGLACGPGAPVCVTVGAFAGGAVAAFGVDWFWGR